MLLIVAFLMVSLASAEMWELPRGNESFLRSKLVAKHSGKAFAPQVLCKDCVEFMALDMNTILNIILQVGVEGTCQDVCSKLPTTIEQGLCEVLCLVEGLKEFTNILSESDLDPVWVCVRLKSCPVNNCVSGCTKIASASVSPNQGAVRGKFVVTVKIQALKNSGTGTTLIEFPCVAPQCQQPFAAEIITEGFVQGQTYTQSFEINTAEDEWLYAAVTYPVQIQNCQYDCGDSAHGTVYSAGYTNFTITK